MSSEIEDWIEENFPKATAENLRRRLAEADVNGAWYTRQIDCFLEQQKGGDVADKSGIVNEQKQRIAELERLYKAAMRSADVRLQAALAAEERAERLEKELATLKSVRVLSGNELRTEWHNIVEVDECDHWDRFAERLQLRCTCPPMSAEELLEIYADPNYSAQQSMERIADRIWPKVAPKPTREEVAARIVEVFRNDVLTVFELQGKSALASNAFGDDVWYAEIVGDNSAYSSHSSRDEAEQAAREMLVDAVIGLG